MSRAVRLGLRAARSRAAARPERPLRAAPLAMPPAGLHSMFFETLLPKGLGKTMRTLCLKRLNQRKLLISLTINYRCRIQHCSARRPHQRVSELLVIHLRARERWFSASRTISATQVLGAGMRLCLSLPHRRPHHQVCRPAPGSPGLPSLPGVAAAVC